MDITTVSVGSAVRDSLKEYRDEQGHPNMNEAIKDLLSQARIDQHQQTAT